MMLVLPCYAELMITIDPGSRYLLTQVSENLLSEICPTDSVQWN